MLITVDGRTAFGARRGIGKTLVATYGHLAAMHQDWAMRFYHRSRGEAEPLIRRVNVTTERLEMVGNRWALWRHVRLPLAARLAGADVLHCPANVGPTRSLVPVVLTIHDLIPLRMQPDDPRTLKWAADVRASARAAWRITTPSQFSKDQIVARLAVPPENVVVNAWGPDPACRPIEDQERLAALRRGYGMTGSGRYILSFGGNDPRKNLPRLVEAFAALPRGLRREIDLVIVGLREPVSTQLQELAAGRGIEGQCRLKEYVPEEDIAPLIAGAALVCLPSLCEGFGLPVVDAFACGTAVVASNTTSIPEIAGDAAVLVDPQSVEAIAEGLRSLLEDEALRRQFAERGLRRSQEFTWERCSQRLADVFKTVVEQCGRRRKVPVAAGGVV